MRKPITSDKLNDHSLVEFAELLQETSLLETLCKRAPVFSKMSLACFIHLSVKPGCPAPEITPGLGSTEFMSLSVARVSPMLCS